MTRVTKETYINESNELLLEDTTFTYNTDPTSTIQNKSNKFLAKLRDKAMISHTLIQTNHFVKRFTNTRFTNIRTTFNKVFFQFDGRVCRQNLSTPMEGKISPIITF